MTELPTSFGKYYLTEKLATGGMAEIYLAKIIGPGGFEKPLVIKQILPKLSGQRHFVDLFVAEAKTLVTLSHGNIVPVYELGVIDDTYFIAMDYIDGPTLYRLTETMARLEAQMEPAVAAWITARMLEGLDYAHRKGEGVIHRDLSPRNVMLSRDGDVKLVDFGIAVTLGDPGDAGSGESAPTGSFPYMSPEQVRREPLTGQTDLFSAGVLAWEMVTGRRLFARGEADATLAAVLGEEIPRPSTVRPEIPAKLDEVVMRALERDRTARWQSAADMLAALNKYLYSLDETPGPRDVAALVARFCPPQTRRLPTHLEAAAHEGAREPLADGAGAGDAAAAPARSGPSTAVIPRDQQARGKPQRQRSFATNVEIKSLLERATPPVPFDAIDDSKEKPAIDTIDETPEEPIERPLRRTPGSVQMAAEPSEPPTEQAPLVNTDLPRQLREPPSRAVLVLAGLGAFGLAIAAVFVFFEGRDQVLRGDHRDAGAEAGVAEDAAIADAPPMTEHDAFVPVAVPVDAPGRDLARDGGTKHGDAPARVIVDAAIDAPPAVKGTATLQIGADPWGDIYVDGKPAGRTPRELTVTAGRHTIEVVFPAEQPPRKQTFAVDLAAGETKPLQADFK